MFSPSSAISPRIAIVLRPEARSTAYSSAARMATGFAFQASLIRRPPPGSSLSCERQRENVTSTSFSGSGTPSASQAVSAATAFAAWWRAVNENAISRPA